MAGVFRQSKPTIVPPQRCMCLSPNTTSPPDGLPSSPPRTHLTGQGERWFRGKAPACGCMGYRAKEAGLGKRRRSPNPRCVWVGCGCGGAVRVRDQCRVMHRYCMRWPQTGPAELGRVRVLACGQYSNAFASRERAAERMCTWYCAWWRQAVYGRHACICGRWSGCLRSAFCALLSTSHPFGTNCVVGCHLSRACCQNGRRTPPNVSTEVCGSSSLPAPPLPGCPFVQATPCPSSTKSWHLLF